MEPPKKPAHKVITFKDAPSPIAGTLETWLARLAESNDVLEEALLLLRDLYFSEDRSAEDSVLDKPGHVLLSHPVFLSQPSPQPGIVSVSQQMAVRSLGSLREYRRGTPACPEGY
jgi:hypothetical protein